MNNFGNGIPLSTGFDLKAPLPLDSKSVVDTIEELLSLSSNNLVCHGQTTYVEENAMYYQYTGQGELDGWAEFCSFDKVKTIINETKDKLENDITTLEEGLSSKIVLSINGLRTEFSDMASGFLPSIKEDMNGIRSELTDINNNLSSQISQTSRELNVKMIDLDANLKSEISITAGQLRSEFSDMSGGNFSSIVQDVDSIRTQVSAMDGRMSELEQTADGISIRVTDVESDLRGEITATASQLRSEFSEISGGDFSSIIQEVDKIKTDVADMEEELTSSITQTASSIRSEVADFKNEVSSSIEQTASELRSEVSSLDGKYTSLKQTVDEFKIEAGDGDALNAKIEATASEIRSEVADFRNEITSSIEQTASEIRSEVNTLDGKYTSLKQTVDEFKIEAGDGDALNAKIEATAAEIRSEVSAVDNKVTQVQQTANKINWLVKSGTSSSNMQMTDEAINLIASKVQIEAGEIKLEGYTTINGGFKIDTSGNMTAKNGTFEGSITGSSITGGSVNIGNGIFKVDQNGKLTASNADIKGKITATDGSFTGSISGSKITGGTLNIGNGTFQVSSTGKLTASNADIKGKITATDGSFSGTISGSKISGGSMSSTSISGGSISGSSINIGNGVFQVSSTGKLTATNADIKGKITATDGSFKGSISSGSTITSSTIKGGSININEKFKVDSSGTLTTNSAIFANYGIRTKGDFIGEGYGATIITNSSNGMHVYVKSTTGGVKLQPGPGQEVHCGRYNSTTEYSNLRAARIVGYGAQNDDNTEVQSFYAAERIRGAKDAAFNGKVFCGGSALTSDRTLKENIKYISNANTINDEDVTLIECYDFVKNLALATYNYIEDKDDNLKLGFIAQDLLCNEDQTDNKVGQMVIEELKGMNFNEGKKLTYDVNNVLGVILASLQVIMNKIENLENK